MQTDLPTIIARLREASPELADKLPEPEVYGITRPVMALHREGYAPVIVPLDEARRILIGVCAEWLKERGEAVLPYDIDGLWQVLDEYGTVVRTVAAADDDLPAALVEAVIGAANVA